MTDDHLRRLDQIVNGVHRHIKPIRTQCDLFCSKVEEYTETLEKHTSDAIERHRAEDERRRRERERQGVELLPGESFLDASDGERFIKPFPLDEELEKGPPQEDWVWTRHSDYNYTGLREMDVFWRPGEPAHPVAWFSLPWSNTSPTLTEAKREWTNEERLMCECFRLAAVHDYRLCFTGSPHDTVFLNKPYAGRFPRDKLALALFDQMKDSQRGIEDLTLTWEWTKARGEILGQGQTSKTGEGSVRGEWSKAMSKTKMMRALGIDSPKTFCAWLSDKEIESAGNRQTWVIRLDSLDSRSRAKLEKA